MRSGGWISISQGGHFRQKKAPAGIVLSSTGLVKSQGGHFRRKKAPAGIVLSSTGLVKSWVAIFPEKEAPAASVRRTQGPGRLLRGVGFRTSPRRPLGGVDAARLGQALRGGHYYDMWSTWNKVRLQSETMS